MSKYIIFNKTAEQFVGIKVDVVTLKGSVKKDVATLPTFQYVDDANEYIEDCLLTIYEYDVVPYGILNLNNTVN